MKYLMVRNSNYESRMDCLKNGFIGYGWSYINFKECKAKGMAGDELINELKKAKYTIGRHSNMIKYFYEIEKDDIIVIPTYKGFYLARALGVLEYDENSDKDIIDRSNLQKVEYVKYENGEPIIFDRANINTAFESMLKFRGTIKCIWEENYKKIIDECFENKEIKKGNIEIKEKEVESVEKLKQLIKVHLKDYSKTSFSASGNGFEEFLRDLFRIYGFKTRILSKNEHLSGIDADLFIYKEIIDTNGMLLDDFKYGYYIQAKHYEGSGDVCWGKEQIIKFKEQKQKDALKNENGMVVEKIEDEEIEIPFKNIEYMVVTTEEVSEDIKNNDEYNDEISIIDNELLADMILNKWDELGDKRNVLNIYTSYDEL